MTFRLADRVTGGRTGRTAGRLLVAGVALVALAACGSDKASGGSPTTSAAATTTTAAAGGASTSAASGGGSAALCTARDNLKKSLDALKSGSILTGGISGIQTAVTQIQTDLQAVKSSASADLQPQVKAFEDSLATLQTAIKDATSGNVSGVAPAATAVVSSGATLLGALQSLQCS